ncbi:hypothetical protein ACI65C_012558 [Semiaphis heraclei]
MHDLKNENRNPVAASGRGPLDDQFPTDRTTAAARHSATRRPPSFAKRLLQCCYIVLLGGRQRRRRSTFYARATSVTPTMQYLGHLHTRGQDRPFARAWISGGSGHLDVDWDDVGPGLSYGRRTDRWAAAAARSTREFGYPARTTGDGHGVASSSDPKTGHRSHVVDTDARITGARRPNKIVKLRNRMTYYY